jgi:signal transduction histidine kinase
LLLLWRIASMLGLGLRGLPSLCAQQEVEAAQAVLARLCPPGSEQREEGLVSLFGFGGIVIIGVAALLSIIALIIRFRRSRGIVRQQLKWFAYAGVLAFVGIISTFTPFDFNRIPLRLGVMTIPIAIGIAILRYRLYDIDIIINRTLVYGALTACVVGLYVLIISYLSLLFQTSGSFLISLVATGVVAVLFQPLRVWRQRAVNRLLYGDRDDPYAVLSRLGQRLEATLAPDTVLPAIVLTVAEALKLPYAALALNGSAGLTVAAAHGTPTDTPLHLPLSYQNEPVGELRLATRAAGEAFSPADRRLLDDLARQAGVAAYAVQLTTDLQRANAELLRSRARLVTAREEERRRLRRDLHDGLGPALAAQTLKVGTAKYLVERDPAAAEALLTELEADIGAALAAIRQVVYNLRPPALDELGLVRAIRASVAQYALQHDDAGGGDDRGGLRVVVEAPERLDGLPAAVEVAAYRIVHEALANVVRHAHAQTCQIQLALVQQGEQMLLCLDITDTGCGLPRTRHQGVGLAAMRERAAELGGSCVVAPGPTGGTWVQARLPLPQPPELADQDRVAQ